MKKTTKNQLGSPEAQPSLTIRGLFNIKKFRGHFIAFVIFNVFLFIWMGLGHGQVHFDKFDYSKNSLHYVQDSRVNNPESFNLLRALGQYDSQFYLKIADTGYSTNPPNRADTQTYAFSPAYPILIAGVHLAIPSLELSALVVSQALLLLCFVLIYWAVTRWYSFALAGKAAWLLFLSPFSIFYRGYFSEGLFLALLIIYLDAIRSKKWLVAALSAGFLVTTRFVGLAAILVLAGMLLVELRNKKINLTRAVKYLCLSIIPLAVFMLFCFLKTGNPLFFIKVRALWWVPYPIPFAPLYAIANFWSLNWHRFHSSRVDVISIVLAGVLIYKSRRWLPRSWWYTSLLLWFIPLVTSDTMSASRYQIVNFPLFVYAAYVLKRHTYRTVVVVSALALMYVSIYFVNWYWVG